MIGLLENPMILYQVCVKTGMRRFLIGAYDGQRCKNTCGIASTPLQVSQCCVLCARTESKVTEIICSRSMRK